MLFSGKENVSMCLVAFQNIFRKIFFGVWKRRRKRQIQKNTSHNPEKKSSTTTNLVRRQIASIAISNLPLSRAVVGLDRDLNRCRQFFLSRACSLSLSGNTLKWKWKGKMISVIKAIFFRSTEINFWKIEFFGPTKHPHFRKSISKNDFHPK